MTDRPRRFGLSKSKITMFEQCPKRLWLSVHRREMAEQDDGAEARFATGHEVGAIACALLQGGVMIKAEPDLAAARLQGPGEGGLGPFQLGLQRRTVGRQIGEAPTGQLGHFVKRFKIGGARGAQAESHWRAP